MSPPTPFDHQKTTLELRKLEADIAKAAVDRRKTQLEIHELTHWYQRPSVWQPVAAIVIAVVTALIGVANGWFSTKLESLSNKEFEVKQQIDALNGQRSILQGEIQTLRKERDEAKEERDAALARYNAAKKTIRDLSSELESVREIAARFRKGDVEASTLQNSLNNLERQAGAAATTLEPSRASAAPLRTPPRIFATIVDRFSGQYPFRLPEVKVTLQLPGGETLETRTDLSGSFSFFRPDGFPYPILLTLSKPGYQTLTIGPLQSIQGIPPGKLGADIGLIKQ